MLLHERKVSIGERWAEGRTVVAVRGKGGRGWHLGDDGLHLHPLSSPSLRWMSLIRLASVACSVEIWPRLRAQTRLLPVSRRQCKLCTALTNA